MTCLRSSASVKVNISPLYSPMKSPFFNFWPAKRPTPSQIFDFPKSKRRLTLNVIIVFWQMFCPFDNGWLIHEHLHRSASHSLPLRMHEHLIFEPPLLHPFLQLHPLNWISHISLQQQNFSQMCLPTQQLHSEFSSLQGPLWKQGSKVGSSFFFWKFFLFFPYFPLDLCHGVFSISITSVHSVLS